MNVKELKELLSKLPDDMKIAHTMYSEQELLNEDDFSIFEGCSPRDDGWIQNSRPDKEKEIYLLIRGN